MNIFVAHNFRDADFVSLLIPVLRAGGHIVYSPREFSTGDPYRSAVSAAIRSAEVVIAVVTNSNPTIYYEMGLAAGAGVPTLIAASVSNLVPSDMAAMPFVQLTGDHPRDAQAVARRVGDLTRRSIVKPVSFDTAEAALNHALQNPTVLEAMQPDQFEDLIVELFREKKFTVDKKHGRHESDYGMDFRIHVSNEKTIVVVEVKKYSRQSLVPVEAVRQLKAAVLYAEADYGMLISSTEYTAAAVSLASEENLILCTLEEVLQISSEAEMLRMNR